MIKISHIKIFICDDYFVNLAGLATGQQFGVDLASSSDRLDNGYPVVMSSDNTTLTVEIYISIATGVQIGALEMALSFDVAGVSLNSVTAGTGLPEDFGYDVSSGEVEFGGLTSVPLEASNNHVATIVFDVLSPKAAHPIFAGVPLQYNRNTYGPWANYPYEDRAIIFPDASEVDRRNAVENLIAGSEIEVDEDLSPWNYGGMNNLDTAAFNKINSQIQYQQVLELGSVQIPGTPIFGIGSAFTYSDVRNNYTQSDYTLNYGDHTYNIKSVGLIDIKTDENNLEVLFWHSN